MTGPAQAPSQLGPYPIDRELGRGGMGIVYLGRDTRLDRAVAIKVLPDAFAMNPERLARFEREARLLASLNHPNIAGIYGLEESNGQRFLALEYVEGDTLSVRLGRGPLPMDEALDVCRQIAAALEAAHEGGIIHRDLKPGNVKLTAGGEVKVLDFGLAKGEAVSSISSDPNISQSPTMTFAATGVGMILGTAAYMSPEQARGRAIDKRTDIWSFGCVLFECLTGRQAFAGETVSDTIALILQGEPAWNALPSRAPEGVRQLLARCLEKDPKKRLRDIGDARLELEQAIGAKTASAATPLPMARYRSSRLAWPVAALFALSTLALAIPRFFSPAPVGSVARLSVTAPERNVLPGDAEMLALSPDGTMLAFAANDTTAEARQTNSAGPRIWVRRLDSLTPRVIEGTEAGIQMFWSPDNRYLAFLTQDKLKKVDLRGGSPENLCDVRVGRGGTWSKRGVIVFAPSGEGPLYKISANGGVPEQITFMDSIAGETGHRYPHFLPDGRHFTFVSLPPKQGLYSSYVGSIDSPKRVPLVSTEGAPIYVDPGYLLYVRNNRVVARRFDAKSLKLKSEPMSLGDEPGPTSFSGGSRFSASTVGSFGYLNAPLVNTELVWLDNRGRRLDTVQIPEGRYENIELAPDGKRAVMVHRVSARESDLWIVDLERETASRFTFSGAQVDEPIWSPDGSRIVFASDKAGTWDLYEKPTIGAGTEKLLYQSGALFKFPEDWSPDGKHIMFRELREDTHFDLWALPVEGDRKPVLLVQSPFDDLGGRFSPDGRWFLYRSLESGRPEVYVQSFPQPGRKYQVTSGGGFFGSWSGDGRRILLATPEGVMIVDVSLEGGFKVGKPNQVFRLPNTVAGTVTRDLNRFLGSVAKVEANRPATHTVVLNWVAGLEQP